MKKVILSVLLLFLPILASADSYLDYPVEINGFKYMLDTNTQEAEVTYDHSVHPDGNYYYSGSIEIPASVTYNDVKYNVTSIGDYAFQYCSGITSVTIPNGVTSIGERAFQYCI